MRGQSSGKFHFSAAQAGDHKICFTPNSSSGRSSWLSTSQPNGGIKLTLDLVIGETNEIHSTDKNKLEDITTRVRDLNARLKDIKREQIFQRVRRITLAPRITVSFLFFAFVLLHSFGCLPFHLIP
jgi:p24 family protein alpha